MHEAELRHIRIRDGILVQERSAVHDVHLSHAIQPWHSSLSQGARHHYGTTGRNTAAEVIPLTPPRKPDSLFERGWHYQLNRDVPRCSRPF